MAWLEKPKYIIKKAVRIESQEGLWMKCPIACIRCVFPSPTPP